MGFVYLVVGAYQPSIFTLVCVFVRGIIYIYIYVDSFMDDVERSTDLS
jgi:hypothetical protein